MDMTPEAFEVEVARSTGHPLASTTPIAYPVAPGGQAGETFEALRFQLVQGILEDWPAGEFPLDRMTCQLIQSFAWTQAMSIWTRQHD